MRLDSLSPPTVQSDEWLESRCRMIESAGGALARVVAQVNERAEPSDPAQPGRTLRLTDSELRQAESACGVLHDVQVEIQNALFDCEHELRALREREVSPAELLVDGERLIGQYRFLRRRARVIDGLLAYLPAVLQHAQATLSVLRRVRDGETVRGFLKAPDCGFALIALEELRES